MMPRMRYPTHRWLWKSRSKRPGNQNVEGGRERLLGRYQRLMDRIDPGSLRGVLLSALLAKAIAGRRRCAADEVEICLHAFILFVALYAAEDGRGLRTVRELIADPDAFLGTLVLMTTAPEPTASSLRLFGKRLRRWSEEGRSNIARAARRRLAFAAEK